VSKPVVVIGAGLAGMNAAIQLQNAGREVVVLEAADRAGGECNQIRSMALPVIVAFN